MSTTTLEFANAGVIITGGGGAIGRAAAREFLGLGARVMLVDRDRAALDASVEDLGARPELTSVAADVTKESDVENYVKVALEAWGRIDVLLNNAGIEGKMQPIIDTLVEDFDRVMAVNVRGVFLGMKHVLPVMRDQGAGAIVNTSSEAGLTGAPDLADYVASKHAVTGLTRSAALEAAGWGVRVNSVHPSPVNTPMMRRLETTWDSEDPERIRASFVAKNPMGRYAEPAEIARGMVFLASSAASYITGIQLRIDGGNSAG